MKRVRRPLRVHSLSLDHYPIGIQRSSWWGWIIVYLPLGVDWSKVNQCCGCWHLNGKKRVSNKGYQENLSLYLFLFSCLSIASSLVFSSSLSAGFFTAPLMMILYPSRPALAKNIPDNIRHLSLSPLKGVILMIFSSMLPNLLWWWSLVSPDRTSKYVGGICEPLLSWALLYGGF